jgi:hypothetical protein
VFALGVILQNEEPFAQRRFSKRLDQMILFAEGSFRKTLREFVAHYHLERNHQGLMNQLIVLLKARSE